MRTTTRALLAALALGTLALAAAPAPAAATHYCGDGLELACSHPEREVCRLPVLGTLLTKFHLCPTTG